MSYDYEESSFNPDIDTIFREADEHFELCYDVNDPRDQRYQLAGFPALRFHSSHDNDAEADELIITTVFQMRLKPEAVDLNLSMIVYPVLQDKLPCTVEQVKAVAQWLRAMPKFPFDDL